MSVWDKTVNCAREIENLFSISGSLKNIQETGSLIDKEFVSENYRRAHLSVIDARNSKKLYLLHCTVFPNIDDPSPIYGFDIVCGPTKVSGAFHDFSNGGDSDHPLMSWFAERTKNTVWNKPRELPEWGKAIFSPSMVAIGSVGADELDDFIELGLTTLDHYLKNVGQSRSSLDCKSNQNRYCHYQKQNPRTVVSLQHLGFTEEQAVDFVENNLFPEI